MPHLTTLVCLAGSLCASLALITGAGAADDPIRAFRFIDTTAAARWEARHSDLTTLTWTFVSQRTAFDGAENCPVLDGVEGLAARSGLSPDAVRAEARTAFALWERAAGLRFVEVSDATQANILIGAQGEPDGHAFADVAFATEIDGRRVISRSLICLNPVKRWKIGFDGNLRVYDLRYTFAHEIGHAIGLDHPSQPTQMMSMRYAERFRDLQPGDVTGAQSLYGPAALVFAQENGAAAEAAAPSEARAQSRALTSR